MNKERSNQIPYRLIATVAIIFLFIYFYLNHCVNVSEPERIKSDFKITTGKIVSLKNKTINTIISTKYEYYDNQGNKHKSGLTRKDLCNLTKESKRKIMRFSFPVVYSTYSPDLSRLLIYPEDFEYYGLAFPDSLREMYNKHWKCD